MHEGAKGWFFPLTPRLRYSYNQLTHTLKIEG